MHEDSQNGYVSDFEYHTSKTGDKAKIGLGGSVVKCLTWDLVGKNIYRDNFSHL